MKTLIISLSILAATLVNAQDVFKNELFSADFVLKHRKELALSDAQTANIKQVYSNNMTQYNFLKWDLDAELVEMESLLSKVQVDSISALSQMNKILVLESGLKRTRLSLMVNIKNQLSEEQQNKLKKIKSVTGDDPFSFITTINKDPRVMLKIGGVEISGQPVFYVVDKAGERKVGSMENIDPDRIKNISILKGASAIKLYGEEGANGVIIIHLKKK